jgi:hypothetical protein
MLGTEGNLPKPPTLLCFRGLTRWRSLVSKSRPSPTHPSAREGCCTGQQGPPSTHLAGWPPQQGDPGQPSE